MHVMKKTKFHTKAQLPVCTDPVAVTTPCANALIAKDPTSLVLKQRHQPPSRSDTNQFRSRLQGWKYLSTLCTIIHCTQLFLQEHRLVATSCFGTHKSSFFFLPQR